MCGDALRSWSVRAAWILAAVVLAGCGATGSGTAAPGGGGAPVTYGSAGGSGPGGSGGAALPTGTAGAGGAPDQAGGATGGSGPVSVSNVDASVPYDPSVQFDWPETMAQAGSCEPGTYTGQFTCELSFIPGLPPTQVTGPVTFTLQPSANGEFLEIKNGRLDATANGTIAFGCDLVGKLDCATRTFTASAQNGTYGTAPFGGTFFGDMSGVLDGVTHTLSGQWALTAGTMAMPQAAPCKGPWSAVKQ